MNESSTSTVTSLGETGEGEECEAEEPGRAREEIFAGKVGRAEVDGGGGGGG